MSIAFSLGVKKSAFYFFYASVYLFSLSASVYLPSLSASVYLSNLSAFVYLYRLSIVNAFDMTKEIVIRDNETVIDILYGCWNKVKYYFDQLVIHEISSFTRFHMHAA